MDIRRLQAGDEEAAARVVEDVKLAGDGITDVTIDPVNLLSFLSKGTSYLLAAYMEATPVGFILAYELPRIDGPRPMMFLYEIGVDERFRRQGIAKALIEELKRYCMERNCVKMFVPTSASNAAAMALYRATGGKGGADTDAASFEWKW